MKLVHIVLITIGATSVTIAATKFSSGKGTISNLTENTKQYYIPGSAKSLQNDTQTPINLFVTHGHCSTPFSANIENLQVRFIQTSYCAREMEDIQLSFDLNPNTFTSKSGDAYNAQLKKPGLFTDASNSKISFRSDNVYTMGTDWYQINGTLTIKGVEHELKLFATGTRNVGETETSSLIVHGQLDLKDWGIDYDKIVYGDTNEETPTRWMYLNTTLNLRGC